jgi:predicted ArsR family transcriptional regulator
MRQSEVSAAQHTVDDARTRRRAQVLAVLQAGREPLPVDAVADRLGLHLNTARFHLEQLVRTGEVERAPEARTTPGRPRTLYRAVHGASSGRRSYRLLAEVLARSFAATVARPEQAAVRAGTAWGRTLVDRAPGLTRPGSAEAMARLVEVLDRVGFAPEAVTQGRRQRILLHHCPFLEAARQHPEVVCAVHVGLMDGVLGKMGARARTDRLEPFVAPDLCIAHLTSRRSDGADRDPGRTVLAGVQN